jgi:hypothetical protein
MSTQSRRTASTTGTERNGATDTTGQGLARVARQQLAATADQIGTLFRIQEELLQAQLHMGQRAALMHRQAAEGFRKAETPADLVTLQSTLLVYQWQEAMRFWQELAVAAGRAGTSAAAAARASAEAEPAAREPAASGAASPAAQVMEAAITAAAPMADAFQQMFTAPFRNAAAH